MREALIGLVLMVGLGVPGALAQALGQGEGTTSGEPPGQVEGVEAPGPGPATRPTTGARGVYQIYRLGEGPGPRPPVLRPGETFCIRFPGFPQDEVDVTFETPQGALATTARRDPGGAELTENVDSLLDPRARSAKGFFAVKTNPKGSDAQAFHADMKARAGAGGTLPSEDLGFLDGSGPLPSWGKDVLEAGGVRSIPFVARDLTGSLVAKGEVPVAARASWIYYAGHYHRNGVGGRLGDDPVNPAAISGAGWKDHLDVLVMAACSAGNISPKVTDGARWWKKFEGTLLGYYHVAPTGGADRLARAFLDKVAKASVPTSDRVAHSKVVARSWLEANLEFGNYWASAFDAEGRFYFRPGANSGIDFKPAGRDDQGFWNDVLAAHQARETEVHPTGIRNLTFLSVARYVWEKQVPAAD